jgi:hypothetical protein
MRVGVFGATGQVGGVTRTLLKDRRFPISEVRFFASSRSAGQRLPWGDDQVIVEDTATRSAAATVEQTDWGLVIIDEAHRVGAPYVRDDYRLSCGCWTTITLRTSTAKACTINRTDLVRRMNQVKTSSALRADRSSRLGSPRRSRIS